MQRGSSEIGATIQALNLRKFAALQQGESAAGRSRSAAYTNFPSPITDS